MIFQRTYKNENGESIWTYDTDKHPHNPIRVEHKYSDEFKEYLKTPKKRVASKRKSS
jgi:hypothetical protein